MERITHRSRVLSTLAYRVAVAVGVPLAPLWLRAPAKRRGHVGRRGAAAALLAWAREHRDRSRPLAWFHAASVGEGLQARAVLQALRERRPELQVIVTRFSASADRLSHDSPADFTGYLPYDHHRELEQVLEAVDPSLLVFAKVDVWPELATLAAKRGARVALVAATVDPGSARLRWLGRLVGHRGYRALHLATAVSPEDAERLVTLGASPERVVVTGDPRVDVVLQGVTSTPPAPSDPMLLVAGSTWPADEAVLLDALVRVRVAHPKARLVIAPHEPSTEHLSRLQAMITSRHLAHARWRDSAAPDPSAVQLVDQLGILASLYQRGAIAYVGGGFGARGIHSVLEPAGWAKPVIIGPNDRGVRDAKLLSGAGGLVRLPGDGAAAAMAAQWTAWLEDEAVRQRAGEAARAALELDRDAARRSAELLGDLIGDANQDANRAG